MTHPVDMTGEATGLAALEAVIENARIDGLNEEGTDELVAPAEYALGAIRMLLSALERVEPYWPEIAGVGNYPAAIVADVHRAIARLG